MVNALNYYQQKTVLTKGVQHYLTHIAKRTALEINGDEHLQVVMAASEQTELYHRLLLPLKRSMTLDTMVRYAYTMYLGADQKLHFGLDPVPRGDQNHDGIEDHAGLGEISDETTPIPRQSIREARVLADEDFYTSKWGSFISGYAPIYNSKSQVVAIVGIDLNDGEFRSNLQFVQWRFIWNLMLSAGIALVVGLLAYYASKMWHKNLQDAEDLALLKSRFLKVLGHEIRTPLNGMIGCAQILEDRFGIQQAPEARTITQVGYALEHLVTEVLEYSNQIQLKLELKPVLVELLCADLQKILQIRWAEHQCIVVIDVDLNLGHEVLLDPQKLLLTCASLIDNAIKYSGSTDVGLIIRKKGREIYFEVWDRGIGLPLDRQMQIADANSISELVGSSSRGMGLGLFLCQKRIECMGGSLFYLENDPRGARFFWRLPYQTATLPAPVSIQSFATLKVLVVDDNALNLKVATTVLRKLGLDPDQASSGFDALELCAKQNYHLVLMDIQMPEMSGIETLEHIHRDFSHREWLIVALTANAFEDEVKLYLSKGFAGVISKPLKGQYLEKWLEMALLHP